MPDPSDFRAHQFRTTSLKRSGKYIGRRSYWRLYSIENLLRVLVHSILTAQLGSNWWDKAADKNIQRTTEHRRREYAGSALRSNPGRHSVYFTQLPELNEIIRVTSNFFLPLVPDIDALIARIENLRFPRNIVAHSNFPSAADRQYIDRIHAELEDLVAQLESDGLIVSIP